MSWLREGRRVSVVDLVMKPGKQIWVVGLLGEERREVNYAVVGGWNRFGTR